MNFEPLNIENAVNKGYLDTKILEVEAHLSLVEKNSNEFKLHSDKKKQSDDEFLIEKAVKTSIQIPFDEGLIDNYDIVDEVFKGCLLNAEVNERGRLDLKKLNDVNQ